MLITFLHIPVVVTTSTPSFNCFLPIYKYVNSLRDKLFTRLSTIIENRIKCYEVMLGPLICEKKGS